MSERKVDYGKYGKRENYPGKIRRLYIISNSVGDRLCFGRVCFSIPVYFSVVSGISHR